MKKTSNKGMLPTKPKGKKLVKTRKDAFRGIRQNSSVKKG
jgi:hypothetical protein